MDTATPSQQMPPNAPGASGAPDTPAAPASALRADCQQCFGLCCAALPFAASSDFAFSKAAGDPCRNLLVDFGCSIHARLRETGMAGCTVYDCFGAGQHVAQVTFHGRSWRDSPETTTQMFAVFPVVRIMHELLWYLTEAVSLVADHASLAGQAQEALKATTALAQGSPEELETLDAEAHRQHVACLLRETSALVRSHTPGHHRDHSNADLVGSALAGADLRNADLRRADLIGADMRGAQVQGANLSTSLFLTQVQANAAQGDPATLLPERLIQPGHWGEAVTPRS
jgi:uncharacterized protein YjbI with pentapeptide repeats